MKTSLKLWAAALAVALFTHWCKAGDAPKEQKNLLESVSVQTSAAYKNPDLDKGIWGTALDVNLKLNKNVSLTLEAASFEDLGIGSTIDETSLLVKASLLSSANKRLSLYGLGGAVRDWEHDDWGFGVGLGLSYDVTKRFYVGASTQIRAWIKQEKDLLTTTGIGFRF